MRADVQYNDFEGTAAADIGSFTSLNYFLEERGVNIERYNAIGAEFFAGYSDYFSVAIICVDKEKSSEDKEFLVKIGFEEKISKDDFFDLFKRFNVIIFQRFGGYEDAGIDENLIFDEEFDNED